MVHQTEDIQERTQALVSAAGLVGLSRELLDSESSGLAVAGSAVRRTKPLLDLGQPALEVGPGRGGAVPQGRRLGPSDLQITSEGLQTAPVCFALIISLPAHGPGLVSQSFGLIAQGLEIPLELRAGGIELLLPVPPIDLGPGPLLAETLLELSDLPPELLLPRSRGLPFRLPSGPGFLEVTP
jgi:hypothetical protein